MAYLSHNITTDVSVKWPNSASRSVSNALIVPLRRKKMSFSFDLTPSVLRAGYRGECGSELNSIGPATEKARRPNVLRRCRGTINW